jgi:kinesin family protein C1
MEGYSTCIFAFGQTGSGKTFTMTGDSRNEGLIFRSLREFQKISQILKNQNFHVKFTAKYLEIYNENIKDLFLDNQVTISHDSNGISLKNCSSIEYDNIEDACEKFKSTSNARKTAETNCNLNSSRSHAIFIISVEIKRNDEIRNGSLCLIDLAGSERLNESKSENERLKETQFINKSLSALGNVIVALKRKDQHIPFRDSKLTHLMQDYFTGRSRTTMIVNINPESLNESICSLIFATKVSECSLKTATKNINRFI